MDIQFNKVSDVAAELTVKMVKADYEDKVEKSLKELRKTAAIKGFRPGHAPASLLKRMYGAQIKGEEVNKLLGNSLYSYINDHKVDMLGHPLGSEKQVPQDIDLQDDFTFVFDIALAPQFEVSLDGNDTLDYYDIQVDEEAVSHQLDYMRRDAGHHEEVDTYQDNDIMRGVLTELAEDGSPKEGGIVEDPASLMPKFFKNDEQKKIFEGAKKNDVLVFNPTTAYDGSEAEMAALLHIGREEVKDHTGDFSFQVNEISRFVPAALDQEFFDRTFGKDQVKSEEEARAHIRKGIAEAQTDDSDYKFLRDVRDYLEKKTSEMEFPDELIKRILKENRDDKEESILDEDYSESIKQLKWNLIRDRLATAHGIKVEEADLKAAALAAARYQFASYGISHIPDEYLVNYAQQMLQQQRQKEQLIMRVVDRKLSAALKTTVKLNHKSVSKSEFEKLFEEKD